MGPIPLFGAKRFEEVSNKFDNIGPMFYIVFQHLMDEHLMEGKCLSPAFYFRTPRAPLIMIISLIKMGLMLLVKLLELI